MILVRKAKPRDRVAMIAITRNVWEGNDYVPFVWDRWVEEDKGVAMVAEQDGRVIGLQHGEPHADGTVWLEAIRVAEEVQGRGIGQALLTAGIEWARFAGARAVRLSTASHNPSSNRLAEKEGFKVAQRFAPLRAEGVDSNDGARCRIAFPSDAEDAWTLLSAGAGSGDPRFYTEGWTAYQFTRKAFDALVATHQLSVADDGGRPKAAAITVVPAARPTLKIGMIAGELEAMKRLAFWLRRKASEHSTAPIRATVPLDALESIRALEAAGFERSTEWHMVLHELAL